MTEESSTNAPANDAHLIQLVRTALGREAALRDEPRLNVSSCGMVVSLHGVVRGQERRALAEEVSGSVRGVEGVINKLRIP